jgi:hypothetical protein
MITFDGDGNRNDVEHYSSSAQIFSDFVPINGWDSPVKETVESWFSANRPQLLDSEELRVSIHQHLDACSRVVYLETRALVAATLLDVLAGRYAARWAKRKSQNFSFNDKLTRLLGDVGINIGADRLNAAIKARNSLVHAGRFLTTEQDKTYREFRNLLLLGRSILLHLIGLRSTLHELIEV